MLLQSWINIGVDIALLSRVRPSARVRVDVGLYQRGSCSHRSLCVCSALTPPNVATEASRRTDTAASAAAHAGPCPRAFAEPLPSPAAAAAVPFAPSAVAQASPAAVTASAVTCAPAAVAPAARALAALAAASDALL